MFNIVPSKYMTDLIKRTGFELSDFNKATLIWNAEGKSHSERLNALMELSDASVDDILKKQISERIAYENGMVTRFEDNSDRKYVYVVEDNDSWGYGYFANSSTARMYGENYCKKNEEERFSISKQLIFSESDVRSEEEFSGYDGLAVSQAIFSADGQMQTIWSNEMTEEEINTVDDSDSERFEYQFIGIPFEGKLGTPVRDIISGEYGVLMNDKKSWEEYLQKIVDKKFHVDYSDVQVVVLSLMESGLWAHDHINPIYLEMESPNFDYKDEKSAAYAEAFKAFSEYWLTYKEGNDINKELGKKVIETAKCFYVKI